MRNVVMSFAATVVALSLMAASLIGQSTPLQGTWKLNVAKSTHSPGPAPKSQTLKWEPVAGGLKFTTDTLNAQGQAAQTETIEKSDGSEAPVNGAQTPGTTRFLKRIDDRTYEDGDKVNGKATMRRQLVVSQDGKTLTVTSKGTNPQGQVVNNVSVFDKQP